jgi:thioredoxin 1
MDFYTVWCGPCRMQTPIIEELEATLGDDVEFRKIDADKETELSAKYGIFVIPTIIIEKDGVEINRYMGVTSKEVLQKALTDAMK